MEHEGLYGKPPSGFACYTFYLFLFSLFQLPSCYRVAEASLVHPSHATPRACVSLSVSSGLYSSDVSRCSRGGERKRKNTHIHTHTHNHATRVRTHPLTRSALVSAMLVVSQACYAERTNPPSSPVCFEPPRFSSSHTYTNTHASLDPHSSVRIRTASPCRLG